MTEFRKGYPVGRWCVTHDNGDPAFRCCGGACMHLTDILEYLGTIAGIPDRQSAEDIVLALAPGESVALPNGERLWRSK